MKVWYVVGIVVLVVVVGYACMNYMMGFFWRAALSSQGVNVNSNGAGYTVNTPQGNLQVGNAALPSDWPKDVPTYPGASVTTSYSGTSGGKSGAAVVLKTSDSVAKVGDWYKAQLAANGWTVNGSYQAGGVTIIGAEKGGQKLAVEASASGGSTQIAIQIGQ